MTGLSRIALGSLPAGKQVVDSCVAFKREMNKRIGRVEGAYLLTVDDQGRRGIEAVYAPDEPRAQAWAEQARDASREVWEQVKRVSSERTRA